jgi:hypothetical protein
MLASEAVAEYGTVSAAARALQVSRQSLGRRLERELKRNERLDEKFKLGPLTFPKIPNKHEPIGELLDRCETNYKRLRKHTDASTWQQIKVDDNLPIGIVHFGDCHLDDPGCNIPLLRKHVNIVRDTEGCFALNVGDYTNNWVGRLARLFANQDLGQSSARRLVEWLLVSDFGLNGHWLAVVLGNHDEWNEGGEIIRGMVAKAKVHIPVHEWAAKIELVFPNKAVCRINTAHDFKGRSMYSAVHGLRKEAMNWQDGTHIYVAGHIHFGEILQFELPNGRVPWLLRVRGYKEMDSHALVNGFHEGRRFSAVMTIIDPNADDAGRVLVFTDLDLGASVLGIMRDAAQAKHAKTTVTSQRRSRTSATRSTPAKPAHQKRKTK